MKPREDALRTCDATNSVHVFNIEQTNDIYLRLEALTLSVYNNYQLVTSMAVDDDDFRKPKFNSTH